MTQEFYVLSIHWRHGATETRLVQFDAPVDLQSAAASVLPIWSEHAGVAYAKLEPLEEEAAHDAL